MAAGEGLDSSARHDVDRAIRLAEQTSRFEFSVFYGSADSSDTRAFAERLHAALVAPARSVLIMVDPVRRALEVVTGSDVRRHLTDAEVELAMIHMQSDFADGDVVGGITRGITMLAEHARPQRTLHADHS